MVQSSVASKSSRPRLNVADRLGDVAARTPDALAIACPCRNGPRVRSTLCATSGQTYATVSFAHLDADATRLARGLAAWGVRPGTRLALLVRPGIELVTLVFALLRAGVVMVLVDPGLGRRHLVRCLAEAQPAGFVAVPAAQAARLLYRRCFRQASWNVTVGRRWFWGGLSLDQLRHHAAAAAADPLPVTRADDPAAVIFTSGSTGPPKGVLYTQRMFDAQVAEIQRAYDIQPGGVDLSCFPLFALFNAAMGVTTVLPKMDFARPAAADPKKLLAAARDWQVTQAFASPAVWQKLAGHCHRSGERIETLRQVFSCGAPVPADVVQSTLACAAAGAQMHTPYGATECLPVSTIEAAEVLGETASKTDAGAGVCVGRPFDSIEWRVIRIADEPIATIDEADELPPGEIGELIVRGPQASPGYVTGTASNAQGKIPADAWHRMGDVGYLDEERRFWYCGRKAHRVETAGGPLYTECVEAVFAAHPQVQRAALVGIGPRGRQIPVVIVEAVAQARWSPGSWEQAMRRLAAEHRLCIEHFLLHRRLPVDIRHNAKIDRESLSTWAESQLPELA